VRIALGARTTDILLLIGRQGAAMPLSHGPRHLADTGSDAGASRYDLRHLLPSGRRLADRRGPSLVAQGDCRIDPRGTPRRDQRRH
jgi:hypothetical protein